MLSCLSRIASLTSSQLPIRTSVMTHRQKQSHMEIAAGLGLPYGQTDWGWWCRSCANLRGNTSACRPGRREALWDPTVLDALQVKQGEGV